MKNEYNLVDDSFSYYTASLIIIISICYLNFPDTFLTMMMNIFGVFPGSVITVILSVALIISFNKYVSRWINNTDDK